MNNVNLGQVCHAFGYISTHSRQHGGRQLRGLVLLQEDEMDEPAEDASPNNDQGLNCSAGDGAGSVVPLDAHGGGPL